MNRCNVKYDKSFKIVLRESNVDREASVLESARIEMNLKKMYLFPVKNDFGGNDVL